MLLIRDCFTPLIRLELAFRIKCFVWGQRKVMESRNLGHLSSGPEGDGSQQKHSTKACLAAQVCSVVIPLGPGNVSVTSIDMSLILWSLESSEEDG